MRFLTFSVYSLISLSAFGQFASASLSLQEALESDLGLVCTLNGKVYAIQPDEASFCVEMGGQTQSAARKGLSNLRDTSLWQNAARASGRGVVTPTPAKDVKGQPYTHADPVTSK